MWALLQQPKLYISPQTDRKHFFLYCAKYHQLPPFFIDVITAWHEALCGSRCRVTGVWFPWRLLWFTWDTRVINIPPWWHTHTAGPLGKIGLSGEWICEWLNILYGFMFESSLVQCFQTFLVWLNYPFINTFIGIITDIIKNHVLLY